LCIIALLSKENIKHFQISSMKRIDELFLFLYTENLSLVAWDFNRKAKNNK